MVSASSSFGTLRLSFAASVRSFSTFSTFTSVTRQGVVNRFKTTAGNAASQFNGDRQSPAFQGLRKDACSDRYWKTALAHGFTISYSYVDANNAPLGVFTIRNSDCAGA